MLQGHCRHPLAQSVACHGLGGFEAQIWHHSWVLHLHGLYPVGSYLADSLPFRRFCHVVCALSEGEHVVVSKAAKHQGPLSAHSGCSVNLQAILSSNGKKCCAAFSSPNFTALKSLLSAAGCTEGQGQPAQSCCQHMIFDKLPK